MGFFFTFSESIAEKDLSGDVDSRAENDSSGDLDSRVEKDSRAELHCICNEADDGRYGLHNNRPTSHTINPFLLV